MKTSIQQINLYQLRFQKIRVVLSAVQVLRLTLVLAVALAVVSTITHQKTTFLSASAARLTAHAEQRISQTNDFQKINSGDKHGVSKQAISDLKNSRYERQLVLSNLGQHNQQRGQLFSSYFEGLARRTVDGLWLDSIYIEDNGKAIALSGNTYSAELIPVFIKKLQEESAFRGVTFSSARVEETADQNGAATLRFSLLTHLDISTEKLQ